MKKDRGECKYDFEEIVCKFYPQISFRVKRSIGPSNPDWEDICSDILIAVLESLKKGKFREESSLSTFIYAVTSNKIIDYIREKKRVIKHPFEPNISCDPSESLSQKERKEIIQNAIKKLKPKYADMLYLYYFLDLNYSQIAEIYSLSTRWVSEIIKTAKQALKRIIEY